MLILNHGDDISFNSIMYDIFMIACKEKTKVVQVIIPSIGEKKCPEYFNNIRNVFEKQKEFEKYGIKFKFYSDFLSGDYLKDYNLYGYEYKFCNRAGWFSVYYKIIE